MYLPIAGAHDSRKFVDDRQEMSRRSGVVHTNLSRRSGVVHTRVLQGFKCAGNVAFNLSRVGTGGGHFALSWILSCSRYRLNFVVCTQSQPGDLDSENLRGLSSPPPGKGIGAHVYRLYAWTGVCTECFCLTHFI